MAILAIREAVRVVGDGTWLRPGEVAELLGVHVNTVLNWFDAGRFDQPVKPRRLVGGHRRIHKDSAERVLRELTPGEDVSE
ncbi:helix-turn-helix domain-containing protein [Dactylosporangium salmoneum]|uniref:Helix-turn-helix domain-containing protein n=1 Tax=Dactylosporangium salmoneum TaxID=53361 RepID=A0ABN3FD10_9ACTN